ncbi:MAG: hypothetical protein WBQ18_10705, partial [Solirubrobacteraceae bacterium]
MLGWPLLGVAALLVLSWAGVGHWGVMLATKATPDGAFVARVRVAAARRSGGDGGGDDEPGEVAALGLEGALDGG